MRSLVMVFFVFFQVSFGVIINLTPTVMSLPMRNINSSFYHGAAGVPTDNTTFMLKLKDALPGDGWNFWGINKSSTYAIVYYGTTRNGVVTNNTNFLDSNGNFICIKELADTSKNIQLLPHPGNQDSIYLVMTDKESTYVYQSFASAWTLNFIKVNSYAGSIDSLAYTQVDWITRRVVRSHGLLPPSNGWSILNNSLVKGDSTITFSKVKLFGIVQVDLKANLWSLGSYTSGDTLNDTVMVKYERISNSCVVFDYRQNNGVSSLGRATFFRNLFYDSHTINPLSDTLTDSNYQFAFLVGYESNCGYSTSFYQCYFNSPITIRQQDKEMSSVIKDSTSYFYNWLPIDKISIQNDCYENTPFNWTVNFDSATFSGRIPFLVGDTLCLSGDSFTFYCDYREFDSTKIKSTPHNKIYTYQVEDNSVTAIFKTTYPPTISNKISVKYWILPDSMQLPFSRLNTQIYSSDTSIPTSYFSKVISVMNGVRVNFNIISKPSWLQIQQLTFDSTTLITTFQLSGTPTSTDSLNIIFSDSVPINGSLALVGQKLNRFQTPCQLIYHINLVPTGVRNINIPLKDYINVNKRIINYGLNKNSNISIKLFNLGGKLIFKYEDLKNAGIYSITLPQYSTKNIYQIKIDDKELISKLF